MSDQKPRPAPLPLRLAPLIRTRVTCSTCASTEVIEMLPLEFLSVEMPPTVDRVALARLLPDDWQVGVMRPLGMGLVLKDGPPPDAVPMPVVFCAACKRASGRG